jgi:hypothetical protein
VFICVPSYICQPIRSSDKLNNDGFSGRLSRPSKADFLKEGKLKSSRGEVQKVGSRKARNSSNEAEVTSGTLKTEMTPEMTQSERSNTRAWATQKILAMERKRHVIF